MNIIDPTHVGTGLALFLFVAIVVMLELGRRVGRRRAPARGRRGGRAHSRARSTGCWR